MKTIALFCLFALSACGPAEPMNLDTDEDGVADHLDACPAENGAENNGCPSVALAPLPIGTYEGAATIGRPVGPLVGGCHSEGDYLFMRLVMGPNSADDGTGALVISNADPVDLRMNSTASLGGTGNEARTYALAFSPDGSTLSGRVEYRRNAAAADRTQCSGYDFTITFRRIP